MTTGIRIAAVPVFDKTPLIRPTITIIATIRPRSVFANFVTRPPIAFAIPVSKSAPPTMNIATNKITFELINPENASPTSSTPVTTSPTHMIIDVNPSGIRSVTNITMANARKSNVIIAGLMLYLPVFSIPDSTQNDLLWNLRKALAFSSAYFTPAGHRLCVLLSVLYGRFYVMYIL